MAGIKQIWEAQVVSFRAETCMFLLEPTKVASVMRRTLSSLYQLSELGQVLAAGISRAP